MLFNSNRKYHLIVLSIMLLTRLCSQELKDDNFVLLELFTSQGCSSCPPADKNIIEIGEKYEKQNIYILAYHVDYWDRLGWKDTFGNKNNFNRQRLYTRNKFKERIYTPQLIVNGQVEFNGSNKRKTIGAIDKFQTVTPKATIKIDSMAIVNGLIKFKANISGNFVNSKLHVVLVENNLITKILKGENRGKTINYEHVVKKFISLSVKNSTSGKLKVPKELKLKNSEIIFFLQRNDNMAIIAAKSFSLKTI